MIESKLRKYILPNIFAMIGTSCYVLADTFFIAKAAGADGITALNLALPVYGLIFAIGSMIGIGSATRYSLHKALGTNDADLFFSNSVFWSLIFSLPFVFAGCFFPGLILRLLGADDAILSIGLPYIRIVLCFSPLFMANYTLTAFVRNDGAPNLAMAATLFSGIFNIVFDYLLMFPAKMGMPGAALATGLAPAVSISICMIHYLSEKNTVKFMKKLPSAKKLSLACSLGVVAFVGEISNAITTLVFNFLLLGLVGNLAVAAYGIIANVALVGTALFNGVSQGLQPLASDTHGKGNLDGEHRIYVHSLQIGICIAVVLVGFVLLFTEQIVNIFNSEHSVRLGSYAATGMRLYFPGFLIAAVNIITSGFYSATGKGTKSSVIALSRGVVSIVIFAFILSRFFGIMGVWVAFPVSELFTLLLTLLLR